MLCAYLQNKEIIFIAGGDKFFQPQLLEIVAEIVEKVAHTWVVAVAQHRLSTKVFFIVFQLVLNIHELRIKFVFLCRLCGVEIFVCHVDSNCALLSIGVNT